MDIYGELSLILHPNVQKGNWNPASGRGIHEPMSSDDDNIMCLFLLQAILLCSLHLSSPNQPVIKVLYQITLHAMTGSLAALLLQCKKKKKGKSCE